MPYKYHAVWRKATLIIISLMVIALALMYSPFMTVRGVQSYQWYHDVYVYVPQLNETGHYKGYASAQNTSVYIYGYKYSNNEWNFTLFGRGQAVLEAYGNGTFYAHIEYVLQIPGDYITPILIVAIYPEVNITENGEITVEKLWWGTLYYEVSPDDTGYLNVYNRSKDEYFRLINEKEREMIIDNLEKVLPSIANPICNETSPLYNQTACNYYTNYTQTLLDYYNQYINSTVFYIDEHTVRVYLNYLDLQEVSIAEHVSGTTEPNTEFWTGGIVLCNPFEAHLELGSVQYTVDIPVFEYYGIKYGGGYSKASIAFTLRTTLSFSASVRVTTVIGGLTNTFDTGFSHTGYAKHGPIRGSPLIGDRTLGYAVVIDVEEKLWRELVPVSAIFCLEVYIHAILPLDKFPGLTGYIPDHYGNYCAPCFAKEKHPLYNDTSPRVLKWPIESEVEVRGRWRHQAGFYVKIGASYEYVTVETILSLTMTSEIYQTSLAAREVDLVLEFFDSNNTKSIDVIYVADFPRACRFVDPMSRNSADNLESYADHLWQGVSWCVPQSCRRR